MNDLIYLLLRILNLGLSLLIYAVIIQAVLSWILPDPFHPVVRFLSRVTDPILKPIARYLPPMGGLDLSPLVALLLIQVVQQYLLPQIAMSLLR